MDTSRLLSGRFELRAFLAEGGMGAVYQGYDHHSGEMVAIKRLKSDVIQDDPVLLERFRNEGQALAQLNHPNIVKMIAAIEDADEHYLVMEYVEGGSLRDYLE